MIPFKPFGRRNTNRSFLLESWHHLAVVGLLFVFNQTGAARDFIQVVSPRAEVYTDGGMKLAQQTLDQLETLASVFEEFGRKPTRTGPVRVIAFASEADYVPFRPSPISAGFYQSGPEGDWIVFPAGAGERVVLHEYTHLLLNRGLAGLPQWLEEGLAEFFSTVQVVTAKSGARMVRIGRPIEEHLRNLRLLEPLTAKELLQVQKQSIHYADAVQASRFYATSWALVHMLYVHPLYARHMPAFVTAVDAAAVPVEIAFRDAFGVTLDRALDQMRGYLASPTGLRTGEVALASGSASTASTETAAAKPVPPVLILRLQAELLLDSNKRAQAAEKYRQITKLADGSVEAREAMAFLAMSENRVPVALERFSELVNGPGDPPAPARTVFEYAMLLRDAGGKRETVTSLLERTVALQPGHPEARFLLGVRASDESRYADAIVHLKAATLALPRQFSFWHALGFAQAKLGQRGESTASARKALRLAMNPEEDRMASALLNLALTSEGNAAKPAPGSAKPSVSIPPGWNRKPAADGAATGALHSFQCVEPHPKLRIRTKSGDVEEFSILDPKNLELRNASGGTHEMQFACGALEPTAVKIEYVRASRGITAIEFLP
jgi:tetratricopeptide (TPR) repeat protein